ncbi:hypothetical protein NM688_g1730 [Phlebia brevispora]|uniref:Uncharacterized protein n=1 Tax=Phlebia brevispora TaxID=194682 RepID=A0ACC1TAP2_9APHY|nr:hypothetical protein NM688_g1730 [Phlebia brevispora]
MTSLRRMNKSHKVPNVKLRPALPSTSSRPRKTASHDSGFESEYEACYVDTCPRPFRGVVLCATGIEDKTTIFKQAIELGAQPLSDLTDKVTHVLAVEPGSAKYKCAIEYKIPIMHPSWISESYDVWLRGDDVDFEESVKAHRLPTFCGVVLCISGIEDEATRVKIHKLVTQEGGEYVKDITRPVKVTHLLCSSGIKEGSEKDAEMNPLTIYRKPRRELEPTPDPELLQPLSVADSTHRSQQKDASKPTADDSLYDQDEDGPVLAAPLPAVTMQAWESMLKSRGFERRGSNFFVSQGGYQQARGSSSNVIPERRGLKRSATEIPRDDAQQPRLLSSFGRTDSFAQPAKGKEPEGPRQPQLFRRAATLMDITSRMTSSGATAPVSKEAPATSPSRAPLPLAESAVPVEAQPVTSPHNDEPRKPLDNVTIRAVGEVWRADVRDAIEKLGGRLVPEDSDELVNYIVVRLVSGSKLYRDESDEQERPKYRTECWLERCLNEERICAADEHVLFIPLKIETPVPGAELVKLNYTGLNNEELCWVKRLSRVLGFTIPETFSRHSTHLLCPSRSGIKFEKAQEWGVTVIDMSWLTDIAVTGVIASSSSGRKSPEDPSVEIPARPEADGSDKMTRVEDHDYTMADITNNDVLPAEPPVHANPREARSIGEGGQPADTLVPNGLLGLGGPDTAARELSEPVLTQPAEDSISVSHSDVRTGTPNVNHQMSLAELRRDMKTTCIPSSETPSPVKAPSKPPSPVKLDTKAAAGLLDSITSLVKRPSAEDDDADRRPKRARPTSRSMSAAVEAEQSTVRETAPVPAPSLPDPSRHIFDPFPHDGASQLIGAAGRQDESMCVTYEDPAQRTERLRLMKLMEAKDGSQEKEVWQVEGPSTTETQGSGSSKGKRKSQRKAPARRRTRAS